MKKILFAIFALLTVTAGAKSNVDSKYLAGGVPEENGMVIFRKSFRVPGKTQQEILTKIRSYVTEDLIAKGIEGLRTRMISDGQDDATVVARVEEYMVFKSKPLYLDRTRFRYQISAQVKGDCVNMEIAQISYYYMALRANPTKLRNGLPTRPPSPRMVKSSIHAAASSASRPSTGRKKSSHRLSASLKKRR